MKKVFLGMLVLALGFGTMSLTTSSGYIAKTSDNNKNKVAEIYGATYTCPWNSCCESPLSAIERDIVARGLPAGTIYNIKSTTASSVTYTIF